MRDLVEIFVIVEHETANAILVDAGTDESCWIPKSQISAEEIVTKRGQKSGQITIPEWLAKEKGLI